ncbi:MAG: hypothetical protein FWC39_09570 [Bacteroidetes bacterium]|nr:hypothetical protein [Bacteroidota bacterium]
MKKSVLIFVKTVLVFGMFFVAGCGKGDEPEVKNESNSEKTIPDPEGTIMRSLRNSGLPSYYGGYNREERGTAIGFPDGSNYWVAMTTSDDFLCQYCTIASVGKVAGLGNITKVPTSGFAGRISVKPGYGYVINLGDTYVRLYVEDWVTTIRDEVIGADVKYQFPWEP